MAICNRIARDQVVLYCFACMVHHGSNPFDWISGLRQLPGFIDLSLFLLHCQLVLPSREIVPPSGISFSGIARYFRMVVGHECINSTISDTVSPSFFWWAKQIRSGRFAVFYGAFLSSETSSVSGISILTGNFPNHIFIASESPFIKWKRSITWTASGWWARCCRWVNGGPIPWYDLDIRKCRKPANALFSYALKCFSVNASSGPSFKGNSMNFTIFLTAPQRYHPKLPTAHPSHQNSSSR